MTIKTYSELVTLSSFMDRFDYLRLNGIVGEVTFGSDRYYNQLFYRKDIEWLRIRNEVILRDNGCDLGIPDRPISGRIIIHHIEPITIDDILNRTSRLLDPNNLICTSKNTHDAIHYGDSGILIAEPIARSKNDTCPWKLN